MRTIAIVGGGFSGFSVALNLIELSPNPLKILLFEKEHEVGLGIAFGTKNWEHPLNVAAAKMGLFSDNVEDFYEWVSSYSNPSDPFFLKDSTPDSYLPRMLYGIYLKELLKKAEKLAERKRILFKIFNEEVLDVDLDFTNRSFKMKTPKNIFNAHYLVLAVGVPNKELNVDPAVYSHPHFINQIWEAPKETLQKRQDRKKILIIGTGLTAIDVLLTLHTTHFCGKIFAISKRGRFPEVHHRNEILENLKLKLETKSCLAVYKTWRTLWNRGDPGGERWRSWIDALRSSTAHLWRGFSLKAKKQFLRHLFPLWSRARHRMPEESYTILKQLLETGRLEIRKGRPIEISAKEDGILRARIKEGVSEFALDVDEVINCMGPEYRLEFRKDSLIANLLKKQIVREDELGLGLKIVSHEILAGNNWGRVFALGGLLFGELLETTSVPEIRQQATSIAKIILYSCQAGA